MKTSQVVVDLIKNDATERPIYVMLFFRGENGTVISKKRFDVEAVFSHNEDYTAIYIEQSSCIEVK